VSALDPPTRDLGQLSVAVAAGTEHEVRGAMARAAATGLDPTWVEELILQTYLFCGFPRALNAAREWRRTSGRRAPAADEGTNIANVGEWAARGERTCATVYGHMYARLRLNIRDLHPVLDSWMIVDGYGKVLSRPGLDLKRRELCIVAVCAALDHEPQLHAHLHGALHAGASKPEVTAVLELASKDLDPEDSARIQRLWTRVARKQ
jgi:4-carboxymuconolactone decarboxylase